MLREVPMRTAKPQLCVVVIALALLGIPYGALAHPMGNFSINHYTKIITGTRDLELDYVIDMAEIPTFQETQQSGIAARLSDPALVPYLVRQAESLKSGLTLAIDSQPLALRTVSRQAIFPPGAG